jgi:hypothetical protein
MYSISAKKSSRERSLEGRGDSSRSSLNMFDFITRSRVVASLHEKGSCKQGSFLKIGAFEGFSDYILI